MAREKCRWYRRVLQALFIVGLILYSFYTFNSSNTFVLLRNDSFELPSSTGNIIRSNSTLYESRREILKTAKPILLNKVDVSNGHKDHPHMGGRDVDGSYGYVHDATALRRNPPMFEYKNVSAACALRDFHYHMLTLKVFVDLEAHKRRQQEQALGENKRVKILCFIYTHDGHHDRINTIRETWGQKCDGFMAASNKTNATINAVDISHEGPEDYNNMWQKSRSMWAYVYDNYYDDYDFFHIGGDDMYVIVENLRLYLESNEIKAAANTSNTSPATQVPLVLGFRMALNGNRSDIYAAGGPGYTLNKAAIKALVVDGFPHHYVHDFYFAEDLLVGRTLRALGIHAYDTKDEEGGERYMHYDPGYHYAYRPVKDWYDIYSIDIKYGLDHCAARSISFHYILPDFMKRIHALIYHLCPKEAQK